MYIPPLLVAVILGLVEGATEFLPVSSTGHLIVVGEMLDFTGERAATFEVVIQLGAILAVVWHYRRTLWELAFGWLRPGGERRMVGNLLLAFLPAALIGLAAHDFIKSVLFNPIVVAWALIIGGFVMLALEWRRPVVRAAVLGEVTWQQSLAIGFAQVLAMIPGTSRAATTILGGYAVGLSRPAATEFSFLLAIPTIVGAAVLDLAKSGDLLGPADAPMFGVGLVVAFVSALMVIRGFLRFVESHSFRAFAWYRIAFGAVLLALLGAGWL
ncbi:MAG TPA: undecaprenyl-diphosphate phosphatase [Gemmatimonadales bacterium]|nr:undecaprenyl-diphosphate phosphatase [Gemmatimonadales bacterium]